MLFCINEIFPQADSRINLRRIESQFGEFHGIVATFGVCSKSRLRGYIEGWGDVVVANSLQTCVSFRKKLPQVIMER